MTFRNWMVGKPGLIAATAALALASHAPASAELYINEIAWDCGGGSEGTGHLAGSDNRDEFVELRGTPGMSLTNHYLIFIEAEDNDTHTGNAGKIDNIFDLGAYSMGTNGFLTIRQKGNLYDNFFGGVAPGATDLVNSGSGPGFGSGPTSSIGHEGELNRINIENGGWTAMIIRNNGDPLAARPAIGLDLDLGNDGLDPIDPGNPHHWAANWTILDAIGIFAEGTEPFYGRTYAQVNFGTMAIGDELFPGGPVFTTPNIEPGASYTFAPWAHTEAEIEYVARWGNSTGQSPDDWHIVNVTQRSSAGSVNGAPDYRLSGDPHPATINDPPPPGQVLESNKDVPYRTALFHTLGQPNYPLLVDGALPGDYNEDGIVDAADYVTWRDAIGRPGTVKLPNEIATLGRVTTEDFDVWQANFGKTLGAGSAVADIARVTIPEPTAWLLAAAALCGVAVPRRR